VAALMHYQGSGEGTPVRLAVLPVTVLITKKFRPMLEDDVAGNATGGSGWLGSNGSSHVPSRCILIAVSHLHASEWFARFGPATPTRAGRLADASVDQTEARCNRLPTAFPWDIIGGHATAHPRGPTSPSRAIAGSLRNRPEGANPKTSSIAGWEP